MWWAKLPDSQCLCAQSFNWDCGLACAEMALRALGVKRTDCTLSKLRQRVPSSSVWCGCYTHASTLRDRARAGCARSRGGAATRGVVATRPCLTRSAPPPPAPPPLPLLAPPDLRYAGRRRTVDLAYLLRDFGIRFRYLTTTLGVDPSYQSEPFYRNTLDADSMRVNKLFAQAATKEVKIERRSLKPDELQVCPTARSLSSLPPPHHPGRPARLPACSARRPKSVFPHRSASRPCQKLLKPHDHMVMALVDRRYLYRAPASSVSGRVESALARCFTGEASALLIRLDPIPPKSHSNPTRVPILYIHKHIQL